MTFDQLILLSVAAIFGGFGGFLASYLKEKGKNTATKEDIGEITSKIENVKSEFSETLERLRAGLEYRSHFGKLRYERELKIYEEIWPKMAALAEAVLSLRPVIDAALGPGETHEARNQKRREVFTAAFMSFSNQITDTRPFYPPEVWAQLLTVREKCWNERIDHRGSNEKRIDYWEKALENANDIVATVDCACEAIRTRLTKFDELS